MANDYTTFVLVRGDDLDMVLDRLATRRKEILRLVPDKVAALEESGMDRKEAIARLADERSGPVRKTASMPVGFEEYERHTPFLMALMTEASENAEVLLSSLRPLEGEEAVWGMPASVERARVWWGSRRETRNSTIALHDRMLQMRISTPSAPPLTAIAAFAREHPDLTVTGGWYDDAFDDLAAFYTGVGETGIVDLEPKAFPRPVFDPETEELNDRDLMIQLIADSYELEKYEGENPGYVRKVDPFEEKVGRFRRY